MYFLDTNIVLRLSVHSDLESPLVCEAVELLELRGERPCIGLQILAETWVVATRPVERNGLGWSAKDARTTTDEARGRFPLIFEDATTVDRWVHIVSAAGIKGARAHDARIPALMATNGVSHLLTLNVDDFAGMLEVVTVHPRAVVG